MEASSAAGGGDGGGGGGSVCTETASGHRHRSDPGKRRSTWGGLRQRWKLLGLFEIDRQHEFYGLTCMMKEGLAVAIQNTEPTTDVSEEDFKSEVTVTHKDFSMKTYSGRVFSSLRLSLGLSEREYQQSLCSDSSYLQFISNSKSRADFFLTNDKRFFLKTQNQREIKFLLTHLSIYVDHLKKYPHSLLVRFLGVHRIKIPHRQKKYFIVMQSVFYPYDRISARYDIKGCELSRWTNPAPEGSHMIVVLKDLNFEGQFITLDQQRPWLLQQVEIDTHFLQRLRVLDYSLLLAHQPLQRDERHQNLSFASLIVRTKKSVNPGSSPVLAAVPGEVPEDDSAVPLRGDGCPKRPPMADASKPAASADETTGGPDFKAQNRRLLPNLKNPLHVVDGPDRRYFVGIIDIFTVYGVKKRLEHLWKRLRHPGRSFSTVSPPTYCRRLCRWLHDHTK